MRKVKFEDAYSNFKINSNKKVMKQNKSIIHPEVGKDGIHINSVSFTESDKKKLDKLRAKYKISRSAIIRILLDNIDI